MYIFKLYVVVYNKCNISCNILLDDSKNLLINPLKEIINDGEYVIVQLFSKNNNSLISNDITITSSNSSNKIIIMSAA